MTEREVELVRAAVGRACQTVHLYGISECFEHDSKLREALARELAAVELPPKPEPTLAELRAKAEASTPFARENWIRPWRDYVEALERAVEEKA